MKITLYKDQEGERRIDSVVLLGPALAEQLTAAGLAPEEGVAREILVHLSAGTIEVQDAKNPELSCELHDDLLSDLPGQPAKPGLLERE